MSDRRLRRLELIEDLRRLRHREIAPDDYARRFEAPPGHTRNSQWVRDRVALPTVAAGIGLACATLALGAAIAKLSSDQPLLPGVGPTKLVVVGSLGAGLALFLFAALRSLAWRRISELRTERRDLELHLQRAEQCARSVRESLSHLQKMAAAKAPIDGFAVASLLLMQTEGAMSAGRDSDVRLAILRRDTSAQVFRCVVGFDGCEELAINPSSRRRPLARALARFAPHHVVTQLSINDEPHWLVAVSDSDFSGADSFLLEEIAGCVALVFALQSGGGSPPNDPAAAVA